jgi:hypothetical protein
MGTFMKNTTKTMLVLGMMLGGMTLTSVPSQALWNPFSKLSDDAIADKLLSTLTKHGSAKLCRKGDAKEGVFSLRSLDGIGARIEIVALTGMLLCYEQDLEGFKASKFAEKALAKIGSSDMAVIRAKFVQKIGSAKGKTLSFGCKAGAAAAMASGVPFAGPAVSTACTAILPKKTLDSVTETRKDAVRKEASTSYRNMARAKASAAE